MTPDLGARVGHAGLAHVARVATTAGLPDSRRQRVCPSEPHPATGQLLVVPVGACAAHLGRESPKPRTRSRPSPIHRPDAGAGSVPGHARTARACAPAWTGSRRLPPQHSRSGPTCRREYPAPLRRAVSAPRPTRGWTVLSATVPSGHENPVHQLASASSTNARRKLVAGTRMAWVSCAGLLMTSRVVCTLCRRIRLLSAPLYRQVTAPTSIRSWAQRGTTGPGGQRRD